MIAKFTGAVTALVLCVAMSVGPAQADGQRYDPDNRYGTTAYEIYKQRAAEQRARERRAERAREVHRYSDRQHRWRRRAGRVYDVERSCLAIARRGRGRGRSIGIVGEGFGRRACRKAMRKCNRRLDIRQSYGRNPFAACVIAGRG